MFENDQTKPTAQTYFKKAVNHIKQQGDSIGLPKDSVLDAFSVGVESKNPQLAESVRVNMRARAATSGAAIFGDDWNGFTEAQKRAFAITSAAGNNLSAYRQAATSITFGNEAKIPRSAAGDVYLDPIKPSVEAFDDRSLHDSVSATTVINTLSARQDDFGEMFYPTKTLAPNEGNVVMTVENTYIMPDYLHTDSNKVPDQFGGVSIIDAIVNPKYLRDDAIKVVPIYDGSDDKFVHEIGMWVDKDTGKETGALAFGVWIDLLGISSNPNINLQQTNDSSDNLDLDVRLGEVYMKLTKGGKSEILKYNLKNVPGSQFTPHQAKSLSRDMALNFMSEGIPLHGEMTKIDGSQSELLQYLRDPARADWIVYLDVNLHGSTNLETSNTRVNESRVQVASIFRQKPVEDGMVQPEEVTDDTAINEMKTHFDSIELIGWYPHARRTNLNRRERGLLIRTDTHTETLYIPMGPPISVLTPVIDTPHSVDIDGPVRMNRVRNSQRAVESLLNYGDMLREYENTLDSKAPMTEVEGVGRYIMKPYFREVTIDMLELVNSLESNRHADNINAAIINVIRAEMTRAWAGSNYGPAWSAMGKNGKPTVNIGTDTVTGSYLNLQAEDRLMGPLFKTKHASTFNKEFGRRIVLNLTSGDDDVCFTSGNFYYIPEVVSTMPKTTNGSQVVQMTAQNRNLHVNHCPIQVRINLKNLNEAFTKAVPVRTVNSGSVEVTGTVTTTTP